MNGPKETQGSRDNVLGIGISACVFSIMFKWGGTTLWGQVSWGRACYLWVLHWLGTLLAFCQQGTGMLKHLARCGTFLCNRELPKSKWLQHPHGETSTDKGCLLCAAVRAMPQTKWHLCVCVQEILASLNMALLLGSSLGGNSCHRNLHFFARNLTMYAMGFLNLGGFWFQNSAHRCGLFSAAFSKC